MNLRARFVLTGSALALSLLGAVTAASAQARDVQVTTVTTTTTIRGAAPLKPRELADLLEAKLIAMTGSHDAAWILQGMHGRVRSDDVKAAYERRMRVWEWP